MSDDSSSDWANGVVHTAGAISSLVAYFSHASYTGWAGVGKALLTGAGAEIGAGLGGGAGVIAGGIAGLILGAPKQAAVVGGLIGALYGAVHAHDISDEFVSRQAAITQTETTGQTLDTSKPSVFVIPAPN